MKRTKLSELSVLFTQDKCVMILTIYYYKDQFKKNEMGARNVAFMQQERSEYRSVLENL